MQSRTHHGARRGGALALGAALAVLGLASASSAQAACFGKKPTIRGTAGADRITGTNGPGRDLHRARQRQDQRQGRP